MLQESELGSQSFLSKEPLLKKVVQKTAKVKINAFKFLPQNI